MLFCDTSSAGGPKHVVRSSQYNIYLHVHLVGLHTNGKVKSAKVSALSGLAAAKRYRCLMLPGMLKYCEMKCQSGKGVFFFCAHGYDAVQTRNMIQTYRSSMQTATVSDRVPDDSSS